MEKHPLNLSDIDPSSKRQKQEAGASLNEESDSPHHSESQSCNEEFICDDCRSINWSSIPVLVADGLTTKFLDLGPVNATVAELRDSTCRICAIISTIKDPDLDGHRCVLTASSLSIQVEHDGHRLKSQDNASRCAVLNVMKASKARTGKACYEKRCLAVTSIMDLESSRVTPASIDCSKFKELLKFCENEHNSCCATESGSNVLGLEVINTKTQEVIKAPDDCEYLALSYVWGNQIDSTSTHDIRNAPLVIRDSISFANSMGYNYLWVDRYCISRSEDKHRIISQMDQIYAQASFTIIAAADGDTGLGLCGISMPRQPQRNVNVQDVALLELPLPAEDLTASKWTTRGWTYQEGYLSRRRLVFTKSQVVFLCNGMYSAESLQNLLGNPCFSTDTREFHHLIPRFQGMQRRFSASDLLYQIQEYSMRELTRSSDSLNAILGVLNYYTRTSANLTSPVLQLPWGLIANKHAKKNSFSLYIFWYHFGGGVLTRRPEFPSWSWTGWGGLFAFWSIGITILPENADQDDPMSYLGCKISLRDGNGNTLEMYDLACEAFEARKSTRRLEQLGAEQLQVTCLVVSVRFQELHPAEDQRKHATSISINDTGEKFTCVSDIPDGPHPLLEVWKGIYVGKDWHNHVYMDQEIDGQDRILGLLFAGRREKSDFNYFHCLLARETGGDLYERVGILTMGDMTTFNGSAYFDAMGCLLGHFAISNTQRRQPFADTAERKTIRLV